MIREQGTRLLVQVRDLAEMAMPVTVQWGKTTAAITQVERNEAYKLAHLTFASGQQISAPLAGYVCVLDEGADAGISA